MELKFECDRGWDDLTGSDATVRHCEQCEHEIYNVSSMTRAQAREFLRLRKEEGLRTCVYYKRSPGGRIRFADDPEAQIRKQRFGLRKLVIAAALIPGIAAVCDIPTPLQVFSQVVMIETTNGEQTEVADGPEIVINFLFDELLGEPERQKFDNNAVETMGIVF
jgi:hypothetical protein